MGGMSFLQLSRGFRGLVRKRGETPTYYCSVSQKMWCKVESAKKAGEKFELHYDCAGKKRKVTIGGEDERVSSGKEKPSKSCGGAKLEGESSEKKEGKKKEGEKNEAEGKKKEGEKKEGEEKKGKKEGGKKEGEENEANKEGKKKEGEKKGEEKEGDKKTGEKKEGGKKEGEKKKE